MMMFLLLWLWSGPPPEGAVLTVYRDRAALPPAWAKLLPAAFDFRTEMLATAATPDQRVRLIAPGSAKAHGFDLVITPEPRREPGACPPCRGVREEPDLSRQQPVPLPSAPLFRVPRAAGRVIEARSIAAVLSSPCPICTAP